MFSAPPNPDSRPRTTRAHGLLLAIALSLAFGTVFAVLLAANFRNVMNPRVADWLAGEPLWTPTFKGRIAWFGLAHLLLHLAFGAAIWLCAIGAEKAFPAARFTRRQWVVAWFVALASWVLARNVAQFVDSVGAQLLCCELLPQGFYAAATAFIGSLLALALALILWRTLAARPAVRRFALRAAVYGALLVAAVGAWHWTRSTAPAAQASAQPNLIVIGIDSLRPDFTGLTGEYSGLTPNIDAFLADGAVFSDVVTPLARTHPAWVSILTGLSPVRSGVRENLYEADSQIAEASVAHRFRAAGYRTLYGTDEVRFSNIDESFGFDRILSPRMGVTDFLLGSINDAPLANLLVNTPVGRLLFPDSYANRAAAPTYRPASFVDRIAAGVDAEQPLFLAVHLALPHWPYKWAAGGRTAFTKLADTRYQYAASIVQVDEQFGMLIDALERRGVLENAVVVVLSDHGEGLGLVRDNLLHDKAAKRAVGKLSVSMWGHGNSVFSPHQYSVVLGARGFGRQALTARGARNVIDAPASLEDVGPTLLGLAGLSDAALERDGVDWTGELRAATATSTVARDRIRYTETGYIVGFGAKGNVDAGKVAETAVRKYRIDGDSGRIHVRREALPALLLEKERAAMTRGWVLGAVRQDGRRRYILVNGITGAVQELHEPPAEDAGVPFELWRALHAHYGAELAAPGAEG
jgi:arylsulfatase A-like enzyme